MSAVIPTMLDEARLPFIRAALDSALGQRMDDLEIIVVHNGSDPGRKHLIGPYLPKIQYCHETLANVGEARNAGVRQAQGDYVAFLDDDDLWLPDKLSTQLTAMKMNPDVDVMFTDVELFDERGIIHPSYIRHVGGSETLDREARPQSVHVQRGDWFEYLIRDCPFLPSCWMAKRDVLLRMPFARTLSEDRELLWRLSRNYVLGYVDQVLARKRNHASNISSDLEACALGMIESSRNAYAWALSARQRALVRSWEANAHFEIGYSFRKRGEHLRAAQHQLASLRLRPRLLALREIIKNALLIKGPPHR